MLSEDRLNCWVHFQHYPCLKSNRLPLGTNFVHHLLLQIDTFTIRQFLEEVWNFFKKRWKNDACSDISPSWIKFLLYLRGLYLLPASFLPYEYIIIGWSICLTWHGNEGIIHGKHKYIILIYCVTFKCFEVRPLWGNNSQLDIWLLQKLHLLPARTAQIVFYTLAFYCLCETLSQVSSHKHLYRFSKTVVTEEK